MLVGGKEGEEAVRGWVSIVSGKPVQPLLGYDDAIVEEEEDEFAVNESDVELSVRLVVEHNCARLMIDGIADENIHTFKVLEIG